jgi:hypothetical protein
MSKSNYRRCVRAGVTGRQTETCFPASIDKLLPGHRVDPEVYVAYAALMARFTALSESRRREAIHKMYYQLSDHLGIIDFEYRRARSIDALKEVVHSSLKNGYQVILHVDGDEISNHAVGLEAINRRRGQFHLVSNRVPPGLRGVITLDEIFPRLDEGGARVPYYPFVGSNVTLVPAA